MHLWALDFAGEKFYSSDAEEEKNLLFAGTE
jgi:hypothetical protein